MKYFKVTYGVVCVVFLLTIFILVCGCSSTENNSSLSSAEDYNKRPILTYNPKHYPVTIETYDSNGMKTEVTYYKPPQRIIAFWQNSVEDLIALGVGSRIIAAVGVPSPKFLLPQYREVYSEIPYKITTDMSLEYAMSLEPDFIVAWYSTFEQKRLRGNEFWNQRGVNIMLDPTSVPSKKLKGVHTLNDEYTYILNLGKIFDREEQANKIVNEMKNEINNVVIRTRNEKYHPRTLIMEIEERGGLRVYGKETLAGNILEQLNGRLLLPAKKNTNLEELIELNPEVIFLVVIEDNYMQARDVKNSVYNNPLLQTIPAVKNKRVYILPLYTVYAAGIRSLDGIRIMAHGLYPNLPIETSPDFPSDPQVDIQFNAR